jgi:hypothetical protein
MLLKGQKFDDSVIVVLVRSQIDLNGIISAAQA